jgi:hypothetical protein
VWTRWQEKNSLHCHYQKFNPSVVTILTELPRLCALNKESNKWLRDFQMTAYQPQCPPYFNRPSVGREISCFNGTECSQKIPSDPILSQFSPIQSSPHPISRGFILIITLPCDRFQWWVLTIIWWPFLNSPKRATLNTKFYASARWRNVFSCVLIHSWRRKENKSGTVYTSSECTDFPHAFYATWHTDYPWCPFSYCSYKPIFTELITLLISYCKIRNYFPCILLNIYHIWKYFT